MQVLMSFKQETCLWKDKQNKVVWRGATTGIGAPRLQQPIHNYKWPVRRGCLPSRTELIRRYGKIYNVGFSKLTEKTHPSWKPFKKKRMTMEEQLTYKYIISLEGNDVASGLKWQLFSNSVVIMPVACRVSWAMEDKLVPYKHYVPVDSSMSNLKAVLDWCGENDDVCCEIARNGKKYME